MTRREFYERCARLLNTEHNHCTETKVLNRPHYDGTIRNINKTRWNFREPGNGRYPGRGLIRHFGDGVHVNLYMPVLVGFYRHEHAALTAIEIAVRNLSEAELAVRLARSPQETDNSSREEENHGAHQDGAGS